MADHKAQLITEVTESLVGKLDLDDIAIVSDEMTIALRDYEVTKQNREIVPYSGYNESIIKKYKACMIIAGRSQSTIYQYERILKKLFEMVGKNYTDMTVGDLRYFLAYEKSRGISNRTLENSRIMILSFFNWMVDEDIIIKNPCRQIAKIKYEDKVKLPFSSVEMDALRSSCRTPKERAIIEVLISSGMRVSELCSVCLTDVNFDKMSIVVREGKGQKQRTVFINELAYKHLYEYLSTRKPTGNYLFYNKKGNRLNPGGVRHILNRISERANVENVYPHRFRRTLATNLANRGMEVQDVSKLLGHADINTTMQYIYLSNERIQVSYQRYGAM